MARPSDWSPVDMDRDPTPGNPDEVRELADDLQTFADDVGEALGRIRGMAEDRAVLDWAGLSAEAFRSEFDGVPPNLQKLQTSYDMAAQALQTYWPKLETAQGMADRALDRAITAQADLSSAQAALTDAQDWVSRAGDEAERLEREGERENVEPPSEAEVRAATRDATAANEAATSAQSRVDSAEEALSAARQLALDAKEMREEAARTCASEIDAASDAGIQNRRWWEDAIHWVSENWDTIVEICKVVVAVLGIVVMIIGGPLAWVVLAAALVVLADTLYDYANGRASLWDVAFAALDCIPGMKGLTTLGGLARGLRGLATTGLRGISAGVRGLGQGIRGLGRGIRSLITRIDPIDMATGEIVMSATDLALPGVLPLALERHHRTSVRTGVWFGPSWASTLDQRLTLEEHGVQLSTEDGMLLSYPRPLADEPVLPIEGPRWSLAWDGDPGTGLTVHQHEAGRTLHFAPVPGRRGDELPLVAISDRNGNHIRIAYDGQGAPTDVVHDGGYHIGVTTDHGRISALRLLSAPEAPVLLRFGYDHQGNLTEIYNSSDQPQRLFYDDQHRITGWEDRNGIWYRYVYDTEGRCVATEGIDGALNSRIVYDTDSHRTLLTDSLGNTTVFQFNDCYQLVTETDPLGHHTHRAWDRYDNLLSLTDPLGRTHSYAYDSMGRLSTIERPDGQHVAFSYTELGLPSGMTDVDGSSWRQEFDARGNRVSATDPLGATTRYGYDEHGGLAYVTDPLGYTTHLTCDAAGLPLAVTTPLGEVTRYRRDAFGRPTEVTDPAGAVTRLAWTLEGKPASHTNPLGAQWSWTWDAEGNCASRTDAEGNTFRYEYGPFDLIRSQINPDGARFSYDRDTELRLVKVTSPLGLSWEYHYDEAGRLVAETDFDQRTVGYVHDAANQLVAKVNGLGQEIVYQRDDLGNVIEKHVGGKLTHFSYDLAGRLLGARNDVAELVLERDAGGRVLAESCNGRTTTFRYDTLGRTTHRRTPGGATSEWHYDEAGRPISLDASGRHLAFDYDPVGREIQRNLGGGLLLQHTWDEAGQLTSQALSAGPRQLRHRAFSYRGDQHLSGLYDDRFGTAAMELDPMGRVTSITAPSWREDYAYDQVGNQLAAHWPTGDGVTPAAAVGERRFEGTRVTTAGRVRYEYDAAGRTVLRQKRHLSGKAAVWRYEWDPEDRLTTVRTPDGTVWRYLYDPLGRRIAKQRLAEDGSITENVEFVWHSTTLIEQTTTETGKAESIHLTWDHTGQYPVAQREYLTEAEVDARFYAMVTDLVGTPTELVDEAGHVAWQARPTLWGVAASGGATSTDTPLRFPGQYFDPESEWHYNYHRYYDPEISRYASPDPLGLAPDPNHYGYVDNPFTWIDPLGLLSCTGRLDRLRPGEMYLYRAVQNAELNQIARTRTFQNPAGIEVKYFSTTPEAAAAYARTMYGRFPDEGPYTLVRSTIRIDDIPEISRVDLVEAGGIEALALRDDIIENMGRIRILPSMPIP
ncbi:DUF6531 domain-containing protein [Streptomyces sp. NPDC127098]|uniref:DUF6531 domain-containing protein n=1 Tax=Streptomyces sp. NPDC127098 TaxID=3347137 RepID=UPI0036543939